MSVPPKAKRGRKKPSEPVTTYFGRALREMRLAKGLTQAKVAYKSNISQSKIPAIEAGKTPGLRLSSADKIARAVGVDLRDLLPNSEVPANLPSGAAAEPDTSWMDPEANLPDNSP